MIEFGLIGYPLQHSWSAQYFNELFQARNIQATYKNFEIKELSQLEGILSSHPKLSGLNVTIPHKRGILSKVNHLTHEANACNAANTLYIHREARSWQIIGHNTDTLAFEDCIREWQLPGIQALILGCGGASRAAGQALQKLGMKYRRVCRKPEQITDISFDDLSDAQIKQYRLIINATPLGMFPDLHSSPPIPYHAISNRHFIFEMVYNPNETTFIKRAKEQGANCRNGLRMLHLQADYAFQWWIEKIKEVQD